MQHFAQNPSCATHIASTATNRILSLLESEEASSSTRRRSLAALVETLSAVPPAETDGVYCLDRFEEVPTTEIQVIGDDILPVESVQVTTEPRRWMHIIVQMCLQQDFTVSAVLFCHG